MDLKHTAIQTENFIAGASVWITYPDFSSLKKGVFICVNHSVIDWDFFPFHEIND